MIGDRDRVSHRSSAVWGAGTIHRGPVSVATTVDERTRLVDRARRLRREGVSVRGISEQLGVPRSTVGDWVVGMAVEPLYFRVCGCGREFTATRSHAKTCPLCRGSTRARRAELTGRRG